MDNIDPAKGWNFRFRRTMREIELTSLSRYRVMLGSSVFL